MRQSTLNAWAVVNSLATCAILLVGSVNLGLNVSREPVVVPSELAHTVYVQEWAHWHRITGLPELATALMRAPAEVRADLAAIAYVESGYNPQAVGPTGDYGLFQLHGAFYILWSPQDLLDLDTNIALGIEHYLTEYHRFRGSRWHAIAAYNAGPRRVIDQRLPASTLRYAEKVLAKALEVRYGTP